MSDHKYMDSIESVFDFYKRATSLKEAFLRSIDLEDGFALVPVSRFHVMDDRLVSDLTTWRNVNVSAYPTQFCATIESTRNWLQEGVLNNRGRIMFLVVDPCGHCFGHLGFNNCLNDERSFEVDNVVRGLDGHPGLFSRALDALCNWAYTSFPVNTLILRVMSDNREAIKFYRALGWLCVREIPLMKLESRESVRYLEIQDQNQNQSADGTMLLLQHTPDIAVGDHMILTAGPSISAMESSFAFNAACTGWNSKWSGYLTAFEEEFAAYVGVEHALATSSCTGALHIALMALGIGPGDEVIVPDQTWVATAKAVQYVGATPIFADVEIDTWNLDARSVLEKITSRTKAIMPVHMYGHPARMNEIVRIAEEYGLYLVEDAAPAIGAEWQGQRCGSFGDFAGFSFQGAKLLVTGEGGMLVTSNGELHERAKKVWDQGRNPSKAFWIDGQGLKYKMSNVQAAIGLGQLKRADALIEMKRRIFSWYQEGLEDISGIRLNQEVAGARSIYWMTSIFLDETVRMSRDELMSRLKDRNIDTRPVFPAISQYPIWGRCYDPQPIAALIGARAINLPSGVCLRRQEVEYVCSVIRELLE